MTGVYSECKFYKYLIDRNGKVVDVYSSMTSSGAPGVVLSCSDGALPTPAERYLDERRC